MLIKLEKPLTLIERDLVARRPEPVALGCAECAMMLAGLGCTPQCGGCSKNREQGMGALDFGSAGIGAGTIAAVAVLAIAAYSLMGNPAKQRRKKLAEARAEYDRKVAEIRQKFGRFGRRD